MQIEWISVCFVIELLVAGFMFAWAYPRRSYFWIRLMCAAAGSVSAAYFFPVEWFMDMPYNLLSFCFLFSITAVVLKVCYLSSWWYIFFAAISGYLSEHFCSNLLSLCRELIPGLSEDSFWVSDLCETVLVYAPVYALFYVFFARKTRKGEQIKMRDKRLILLSGFALFICVFVSVFAQDRIAVIPDNAVSAGVEIFKSIYAMLVCMALLMLLSDTLTESRMRTSLAITEQLLYQSKVNYEVSKANIERINIFCHDLKHQFSGKENGLKEIENEVRAYESMIRTGNSALDVVLTEKNLYCSEKGIRFSCMADGKILEFMEPSELYALFGNLLSNAAEAVMQLEKPEQREISLIIRQSQQFAVIWVENRYCAELNFVDGLPQTTKRESEYHGYGMKSIRLLVKKYGGTLVINTEDQLFRVKILFPVAVPVRK